MITTGRVRMSNPSTTSRPPSPFASTKFGLGSSPRRPCRKITNEIAAASMSPGTTPAANRSITETCVTALKTIMITEGGMIGPIIDDATTIEAA